MADENNLEKKRKSDGKVDGPSPTKQAFMDSMVIPVNFSGRKFINLLTTQLKRVSIRGRLIMCNRGIAKKKIAFLSLVFLDSTGEIRATIWRENLDFWQHRLIVNNIYQVSNFKIVESESRYSRLKPGRCQINFEKWTKVCWLFLFHIFFCLYSLFCVLV